MKNLLTFLLLVMSLLAFGQSNSRSIEIEIQYWKSIAESNDTVAYREYLQRYGEDGLYKDEAKTRIALLKTSGKQTQSKSIECCFYSGHCDYIVRFDNIQRKVWLKYTSFYTYSEHIRYNLAQSRDFYENLPTLALSRREASSHGYGKYIFYNEKIIDEWMTDEEYEYDPMKSTSARDVYFKQDTLCSIACGSNSFYEYKDHFKYGYSHHDSYRIIKIMQGYRYVAFSKDKSSIIEWFEQDDNFDGVILKKEEYKRVPKEELLPKAVNYDFLNE